MRRRNGLRAACRAAAAWGLALSLCGCADERTAPVRVEWPTMGTVAAVQAKGPGAPASVRAMRTSVQATFARIESLLNAHDPKSELRRLAGLSDEEVLARCDAGVRSCYEAAFALMRETDGAFSPRWRGLETLDLGAIAKGFAVDVAADDVAAAGGSADALIDLGGNLKAVRGTWTAGVRDPEGDGVAAVVTLRTGEALATSATYFRGAHVFDGRAGRPVANGVASVTVLCPSALWADALSTALFVLGPEEGARFLRTRSPGRTRITPPTAVLWILSDGRHVKLDPDSRFR